MRVLHLTTHEHSGAGRAVVRIHRAQRRQGIQSDVLVLHGTGAEPGVALLGGNLRRRISVMQRHAEEALLRLQTPGGGYRSLGLWSAGLERILQSEADIVHLHWIPGLLAIADLPRIRRPVVWTFHDQWPMCGAEHYADAGRHLSGYGTANRGPDDRGLDLDLWTWRRKRAAWRDFRPRIVCPSRWLAQETRGSAMFGGYDVDVIANPIDTSMYRPQDRAAARSRLGLPPDRILLLFGAWDATSDRRKGFHILSEALRQLAGRGVADACDLVMFGATGKDRVHGFPTHWMGFVDGEASMSTLYSACDAFVIPSLQDNLPNTLVEAMACGLPVVGSDTGGIPDLVRHMETGLLSAPGDAAQLAGRMEILLRDAALRSRLGEAACSTIGRVCSENDVAARYLAIYQSAMQSRR